jgi:NAD(P)-dependent dehydrogenase (short-subunit alcohol dehydrogenase family)
MQKNILVSINNHFEMQELNLKDKIAIITGGAGVICSQIVRRLASHGVKTAIIDLNGEAAMDLASEVEKEFKTASAGFPSNVLDRDSLEAVREKIGKMLGPADILINGVGGNSPSATTRVEKMADTDFENIEGTFFGLQTDGFDKTFDLNFKGNMIPTMVFAADMVKKRSGSIINISSMSAFRPLTRIAAYSAAKAAINNFTQWLAVHFANTGVRVNAVAPGFLLTEQNKFLLVDEKTAGLTARGKKIINNTPFERYGTPEEITGTVLYLASDWSKFVTGVIIPVDGGFNAYSGV